MTPPTPPPVSSRGRWQRRAVLAAATLMVVGLALALGHWPDLAHSLWWYPESNAYQLWVLTLLALIGAGHTRWTRSGSGRLVVRVLWGAALAMMVAGVGMLAAHVVVEHTAGDLYSNYLEGARRLIRGEPIYDMVGLDQSVNASPVILALLGPIAHLDDHQATTGLIAVNALALLAYLAWGSLLVRRLKGSFGLPDFGVLLAVVVCFFSFQRSWRLGQLDTVLLALICGTLAHVARPELRGSSSSGVLAGLAAAFKLVPGVLAGPFLLRALHLKGAPCPRQVRLARRWLLTFAITGSLTLGVTTAVMGPKPVLNFIKNIAGISQSSTSGNNYALVARIATWDDYLGRQSHAVLEPAFLVAGRVIAVGSLALLLGLTWRLRRSPPTLLCALWLVFVPLISPVCWDIYLLWCFVLPWVVVWALISNPAWRDRSRLGAALLRVALAGSYLMAGTSGNNTYTDLHSHISVNLFLPHWLEELPLLGHLLLVVVLVAVASHSPPPGPAAGPGDAAELRRSPGSIAE